MTRPDLRNDVLAIQHDAARRAFLTRLEVDRSPELRPEELVRWQEEDRDNYAKARAAANIYRIVSRPIKGRCTCQVCQQVPA